MWARLTAFLWPPLNQESPELCRNIIFALKQGKMPVGGGTNHYHHLWAQGKVGCSKRYWMLCLLIHCSHLLLLRPLTSYQHAFSISVSFIDQDTNFWCFFAWYRCPEREIPIFWVCLFVVCCFILCFVCLGFFYRNFYPSLLCSILFSLFTLLQAFSFLPSVI